MVDITSLNNPVVKDVVRLRTHRKRHDPERFLIEGMRLIERARAAGVDMAAVFASEGVSYPGAVSVSVPVMAKMSGRRNPPAIVAVANCWPLAPSFEGAGATPETRDDYSGWWVALVGIEKPGNVGAVMRTASALGASGILIVDSAVDVFSTNVVRNSAGAIFSLPIVEIGSDQLREFAASRSALLVATVPDGGTNLWDAPLEDAVVLLVGSEANGLPEDLIAASDAVVTVPMHTSSVDSLNASVSAGIVMADLVRRRQ
ncbi:MAG: RNA methyltransferase [Acidimicrobiia bacterium]|nr:RNA methyltransferase [Acidimicrobiia bacterium]NND13118.1 RNA methyltransferase [Acidimicrobiia bacterium]NNL28456.1 RNA methyltransferase [Acidimicrobiia bacterium]